MPGTERMKCSSFLHVICIFNHIISYLYIFILLCTVIAAWVGSFQVAATAAAMEVGQAQDLGASCCPTEATQLAAVGSEGSRYFIDLYLYI